MNWNRIQESKAGSQNKNSSTLQPFLPTPDFWILNSAFRSRQSIQQACSRIAAESFVVLLFCNFGQASEIEHGRRKGE
jgi:hypothetical protein